MAATASPSFWIPLHRSPRPNRASTTVTAGYRELITATMASWETPVASR